MIDLELSLLLTPDEVAALWRVDRRTVNNWAKAGWINSIRTPGGRRRFRESEVLAVRAAAEAAATGVGGVL